MKITKGYIFDIKRYAIHDGPGIRTTVFLKGCPLSCSWCANPEGQRSSRDFIFWLDRCLACDACIGACKKYAIFKENGNLRIINESRCDFCGDCVRECYSEALQIIGREMGVEELVKEIEKDKGFYLESGGGVTFSGGEPFSQPAFLNEMLMACKSRNIHTAIDTCGYVSWDTIKKTIPYVDLFLYDIKLMDERKHKEFTGVSNRLILSNLQKLVKTHQVILRVPLIPHINDGLDSIERLAEFLLKLRKIKKIDLLPYHKLGVSKYELLDRKYALEDITPLPRKPINNALKSLAKFGFDVNIGG
jgi:pyruvate formate lyase activating enzyme